MGSPLKMLDGRFSVDERRLMLHDGMIFLALAFVSVALCGVTLLLFRSFEAYRDGLGRVWSEKGSVALRQGHAVEAVSALRTALSYAPDDRADEMMLAQALAEAGRTEEAGNYFVNLWEARPGDGMVNLELARLAKRQGRITEATEYYRAALFGSWEADGAGRRREIRLELADYLIGQHDLAAARAELLIAAGDAPGYAALNVMLGDKLAETGDLTDALFSYRKAVAVDARDENALEKAGRAAYALGDYETAHRMLRRAIERTAMEQTASERKTGMVSEDPREGALVLLDADAYRLLSLAQRSAAKDRGHDGR